MHFLLPLIMKLPSSWQALSLAKVYLIEYLRSPMLRRRRPSQVVIAIFVYILLKGDTGILRNVPVGSLNSNPISSCRCVYQHLTSLRWSRSMIPTNVFISSLLFFICQLIECPKWPKSGYSLKFRGHLPSFLKGTSFPAKYRPFNPQILKTTKLEYFLQVIHLKYQVDRI